MTAVALVTIIGLLQILAGFQWNRTVDATIRSYSGITTGIVTGQIHRDVSHYTRGYGLIYTYGADVIYTVNHVKYRCRVTDQNNDGAKPYFSVGDTVTVNYIPSEPQYGVVFHRNGLLKKQYIFYISGGYFLLIGIVFAIAVKKKNNLAENSE